MRIAGRVSLAAAVMGALFAAGAGAQVLSEGLVFHPVKPCRIFDTRPGQGGSGVLTPGALVSFRAVGSTGFAQQGGLAGGCAIPGYLGSISRVRAVMFNFVAVNPAGPGNLRAWPKEQPVPNASIINFTTSTTVANGVIVAVSQDPVEGDDITLRADGSATHVLADVLGYFVEPDMGSRGTCYGTQSCNGKALLSGDNYLWGVDLNSEDITPTTGQTCMVTATVTMQATAAPISGAVGVRTAVRNITDNSDQVDPQVPGSWGFSTYGTGDNRGTASKTHTWALAPNKAYHFGCYVLANGDYVGDTARCHVSWLCR